MQGETHDYCRVSNESHGTNEPCGYTKEPTKIGQTTRLTGSTTNAQIACCCKEIAVSGRLNWERVRKENLSRLHGSEWVKPSDDTLLSLAWKSNENGKGKQKKNKKKKLGWGLKGKSRRLPKVVPLAKRMVGCTCGKAIGFTGQHKKSCPLRKPEASTETRAKGNWVCPECHATLAGAKVPQPVAMEILLRHQQTSHHRTSGQSALRTEVAFAVTTTPLTTLSPPSSGIDKRNATVPSESKHAQALVALPHKLPA